MNNRNLETQSPNPFEWIVSFAFEILVTPIIVTFLIVVFRVCQVIDYVVSVFNKNSSCLSNNGLKQSNGLKKDCFDTYRWPAIIITAILFYCLCLHSTPSRKTPRYSYRNKEVNSRTSLQTVFDTADQNNIKSADIPLNQAISEQISNFDCRLVQDNLKSAGLYLGPVNGVWGKSSQAALSDLKNLMMTHGNEFDLDDMSLIAKLIKTSEVALLKSEAIEAASVKPEKAIFSTEHDKDMFWINTTLNNEECALTWADDKCVGKELFDAYWKNHTTTATSINVKSCITQSSTSPMPRVEQSLPSPISCDIQIERVRGYYRANGTYVKPYYRTRANGSVADNWSTKGNVNPFTGNRGNKKW